MRLSQAAAIVDVTPIIIGIGVAMQIAADDGLRLVPFGDAYRFDVTFLADPGVEPDEIDEVCPEQQQLRHDRVVVVGLRDMTVGAGLGLGAALGVWIMRRKRLARVPGRRYRRLLVVDMLAV